ncbi:MAG TPA: hypothetical protein PKB15_08480 [Acidimicrobiia bacterium]|nr:hypothetical protein [Acidimicrobiia bacterium]
MVAITEFHSDYEFSDSETGINNEVDLAFLEAIDQAGNLFAINENFFNSLNHLAPQPAFVPSLHSSVFEEPLEHAVWTSPWPTSQRHFPS